MNRTLNKLLTIAVLTLYAAAPIVSVKADDTEIYFGVGSSASARPNVLFIIDDSGSMNTLVGSTGKTRMEIVRSGLLSLLDSMSNVNVGLMNFSAPENNTNGGPILYPVRGIDNSVEQQILLQPVSDDAHQIDGSGVTDGTSTVQLGLEPIYPPCLGCVEAYANNFVQSNADNVEGTTSFSTTFSEGNIGQTDNRVGFRFIKLDIPQGATIKRAQMRFMLRRASDTTCRQNDLFADIRVERVDNAVDYTVSSPTAVSRNLSTSTVVWNDPAHTYAENTYIYTSDISALVQLIVNRSGWDAGNAMAFQIKESSGNDGCRDIYSRNSAPNDTYAPALEIEWSLGAPDIKKVTTGLRFANVAVPQGAKITSAYIEYVPSSIGSGSIDMEISADDVDDSPTFAVQDIESRSLTSKVAWSDGTWAVGVPETTPNIADVVQKIVDRPNWCGGNALTFVMTGDAKRLLYAKEAALGKEAKITINYEPQDSAPTGCIRTTLSYPIAAGGNDVEQRASGSVLVNSEPLGFIVDGTNKNQALGFRFANLAIPVKSKVISIDSAYLSFYSANAGGVTTNVSVSVAENAALGSIPTATNGVTDLALVSASAINWTISGWSNGQQIQSPNLAALVDAAITHASWKGDASGNNMTFVIKGDTSTGGTFAARSFESDASKAARFVVTYKGRYTTAANQTVRNTLKNMVTALTPQSYTPYSGVLLEAANYYKGGEVFFGKQRSYSGGPQAKFHVSHPLAINDGYDLHNLPSGCTSTNSTASACTNETYSGTPTYISPIIDKCQSNHIVFLTDGEPNSNSSTTASKVQSLTGASCSSANDGKECSTNVAKWLQGKIGSKDVRTDMDEQQTVKLHTIGFAASIPYLSQLATDGGGLYRAATDASTLNDAFEDIIGNVTAESSTFVSAGVTVDQFNRVTHSDEMYFAMFKPTPNTKWHGNIKRYRMNIDTIVDRNSVAAIDPTTQKFKAIAQSYWSADGDGDEVEKGGAASKLPLPASRVIYTNLEGKSNVALSNGNNDLADDQSTLTVGLLNAVDSTDRTKIINWARGMDVNNTANPTGPRYQMGDPIHTQPQVVIYDGGLPGTADDKTIIFSTDNEGYLHATNAATGVEEWAWIPQDLLDNLTRFQKNTPLTKRESGANGLDGHIAPYLVDSNYNGVIDSGEKAWLMIGMRRGGNNYYMLDVSAPAAPVLKYTIEGGSGNFAKLGQTWAKPAFGRIKFGTTVESVAVITGGYDEADDNNAAPSSNNSTGNAVYIVRVSDGTRLWHNGLAVQAAGVGSLSTMTHAIPAGATALDVSNSTFIQTIYVADVRGQIFRFDVKNGESDINQIIKGGRIAHIGGSSDSTEALSNGGIDEANNRRFYSSPTVAAVYRPDNKSYVAIAIGSGNRSHPKNTVNKDSYYMIKDLGLLSGSFDKDVTQADLLNITSYSNPTDPNNVIGGTSIVKYIEDSNLRGWRLDFSAGTPGEKSLSQGIIFNNQLIFGTYVPVSSNLCAGVLGSGRAYLININDGTAVGTSRYQDLKRPGIPADPSVFLSGYDSDGDGKDDSSKYVGLYGPEKGPAPSPANKCGEKACSIKWRKTR